MKKSFNIKKFTTPPSKITRTPAKIKLPQQKVLQTLFLPAHKPKISLH